MTYAFMSFCQAYTTIWYYKIIILTVFHFLFPYDIFCASFYKEPKNTWQDECLYLWYFFFLSGFVKLCILCLFVYLPQELQYKQFVWYYTLLGALFVCLCVTRVTMCKGKAIWIFIKIKMPENLHCSAMLGAQSCKFVGVKHVTLSSHIGHDYLRMWVHLSQGINQ